jgi:hypothetical protein
VDGIITKNPMTRDINTTDNSRTIIRANSEEPISARRSKRHYRLWKFARTLSLNEIEYLITIRRKKIKHETNSDEIRNLRTDIIILEDTYRIVRKKLK